MPEGNGTNLKDVMELINGMKAAGLLQVGGQDILSLVDPMKQVEAARGLQSIPTPAPRGASVSELGYSPHGTIFTGGSPHEIDFTGKRVQNSVFLLDQLMKSGLLDWLKPKKEPGLEDIMKGLREEAANRG